MPNLAATLLLLSLPVFAGRILVDATFLCLDALKRRYGSH